MCPVARDRVIALQEVNNRVVQRRELLTMQYRARVQYAVYSGTAGMRETFRHISGPGAGLILPVPSTKGRIPTSISGIRIRIQLAA